MMWVNSRRAAALMDFRDHMHWIIRDEWSNVRRANTVRHKARVDDEVFLAFENSTKYSCITFMGITRYDNNVGTCLYCIGMFLYMTILLYSENCRCTL